MSLYLAFLAVALAAGASGLIVGTLVSHMARQSYLRQISAVITRVRDEMAQYQANSIAAHGVDCDTVTTQAILAARAEIELNRLYALRRSCRCQ